MRLYRGSYDAQNANYTSKLIHYQICSTEILPIGENLCFSEVFCLMINLSTDIIKFVLNVCPVQKSSCDCPTAVMVLIMQITCPNWSTTKFVVNKSD